MFNLIAKSTIHALWIILDHHIRGTRICLHFTCLFDCLILACTQFAVYKSINGKPIVLMMITCWLDFKSRISNDLFIHLVNLDVLAKVIILLFIILTVLLKVLILIVMYIVAIALPPFTFVINLCVCELKWTWLLVSDYQSVTTTNGLQIIDWLLTII